MSYNSEQRIGAETPRRINLLRHTVQICTSSSTDVLDTYIEYIPTNYSRDL